MNAPIAYTSITSAHWQPALGSPGEAVEGLRDIDQAIRIILKTPRGSDPHRPEFGSDLHRYIDWPVNRVVPYLVREAVTALRQWEPRMDVVQVEAVFEESRIRLRIKWTVASGVIQQTEVPYGNAT
jgi:phage baseplate assembly protein W